MKEKVTREILKKAVRNIPDFPKKGIQFKDITTLLKDPELYEHVIDEFVDYYRDKGITRVVAIESRGFILGGVIAKMLGAGFVPVRKPGKLPAKVFHKSWSMVKMPLKFTRMH